MSDEDTVAVEPVEPVGAMARSPDWVNIVVWALAIIVMAGIGGAVAAFSPARW